MTDRYSGDLEDEAWLNWYLMTPQERWGLSMLLWEYYMLTGGPMAPEPDPQSPFYFDDLPL